MTKLQKYRQQKSLKPVTMECNKCKKKKKIFIGSTLALNTRIFLHKSNIKLPENKKLYVSKKLYECSNELFKIMPIYQTDDNTLLQIKKKLHRKIQTHIKQNLTIYTHTYTHSERKYNC